MRHRITQIQLSLFSLTIILLFIGANVSLSNAEMLSSTIAGPVLAGESVGGSGLLLHDIGTGRTWGLWTPTTTYDFYTQAPNMNWSPNGCKMIVRQLQSDNWGVLSILDMSISFLPRELEIAQQPIWHPDSRHLTLASRSATESSMQINLLDLATGNVELLLELNEAGGILKWLSSTQLLYHEAGNYRIWDTVRNQSAEFGTGQYPRYGIPSEFWRFMNVISTSPDYDRIARYYSIRQYELAVWQESFDGLDADEFAQLDAENRTPGFDLHEFNSGMTTHIDLSGAFVQALEWSPSGNQIVLTTFGDDGRGTGSIYVYNLEANTLEQVGDFSALNNAEYGPYVPTWSADEQWLAINTGYGYIAYNLLTEETIELSSSPYMARSEFTGFYMRLAWSPVMDYSSSVCFGNEG